MQLAAAVTWSIKIKKIKTNLILKHPTVYKIQTDESNIKCIVKVYGPP